MTPGLPSCKLDSLRCRVTLSAQQPAFVSTIVLVYLCYMRSYRLVAKTSSNNEQKNPCEIPAYTVTSVTLYSSQNLSPRALVGFLICVSELWGLVKRGKASEALSGKAVTVGLWYVWVQLNVLNFIVHHVVL